MPKPIVIMKAIHSFEPRKRRQKCPNVSSLGESTSIIVVTSRGFYRNGRMVKEQHSLLRPKANLINISQMYEAVFLVTTIVCQYIFATSVPLPQELTEHTKPLLFLHSRGDHFFLRVSLPFLVLHCFFTPFTKIFPESPS